MAAPLGFICGLIVQYLIMKYNSIDNESLKPSPYKIELYANSENQGYVILEDGRYYRKPGQADGNYFTLYHSYEGAYTVLSYLEEIGKYQPTKKSQVL